MENNLPTNAKDSSLIPGLGRPPEEGNGNPLQILLWEIPRTEEPGSDLLNSFFFFFWFSELSVFK